MAPTRPPGAKRYEDLLILDATAQKRKEKTSYHTVLEALKKGKEKRDKYYLKVLDLPSELFEASTNEGREALAFEAACAKFFRLIDPTIAPSTQVYYDDKNILRCVGSRQLKGFKTNLDDPLKEENLTIEALEIGSTEKHVLRRKLTELSTMLAANRGGFSGLVNYYKSSATASYVKTIIDGMLATAHSLNFQQINDVLLPMLNARLEHLATLKDQPEQRLKETTLIEEAMGWGSKYISTKQQVDTPLSNTIIQRFEELDKTYGSSINTFNNDDYEITDGLASDSVPITIRDLTNYCIIRGAAIGTILSYFFKEGDCHNRNIGKNGKRIDFDMTLLDISWFWKDPNIMEQFVRKPNKDTFKVTASDLVKFPNIKDASFFYWPTKQTIISSSMAESVYAVFKYRISHNLFRQTDNSVFKKLAEHPLFIFHKYKTLLKLMLTTKEMYQHIAELTIAASSTVKDARTGEIQSLIAKMTENIDSRITAVRNVLTTMPEFKDFLIKHGNYAFQLIKAEFIATKEKYKTKSVTKKHYSDLFYSINLENIETAFTQLFTDTVKSSKTFDIGASGSIVLDDHTSLKK